MARIQKRMAGPAALTGTAATKYTVPANRRAIVRHIHLSNPGVAADFTASIGVDAVGTRIFDGFPVSADSVYDHFCYYILEAAEVIQASGGTGITLTIDGDEEVLA